MVEPSRNSLADDAVYALTRAARVLERALPGISMADFRMLSAMSDGVGRASHLATLLTLGKPAVSATVDSLVRRGLIARTPREDDRRAFDLALTADGERIRRDAHDALAAVVVDIAAHTPDATATLSALAVFGEGVKARGAERRAAYDAAARAAEDGTP